MTNKRRNTFTKKRVNPTDRRVTRMKGPRANFDGSTVSCTSYFASPAAAANLSKATITVDCDSATNILVTGGAASVLASGVLNLYSEYKYNKCSVEWIPSIGPVNADAGDRIHIAYIDNSEKMVTFQAATSAAALGLVRGCRNVRSFNAWERFTYNVPLTWRRKVFDTNVTVVPGTVDLYERSTQGMIIISIETNTAILAAGALGTFKVDSSIRVNQLNVNLTT